MKHSTTIKTKNIDPVCGMNIPADKDNISINYKGSNYYFCAAACREAFEKNPSKFIKPKRKGIWGRYLDRLTKATEGKSLNCH
jgi:YHS domain-containing protein